MSLEPGEVINNRYRIVKILGQGGFGAVYRAWDINFNLPCALKENLETRPEARRQFEREARMLRTMKHPNLPLVIDYFILPEKGQYLVMDYVEGQDLNQMVEASGSPLPEPQVLNWIGQICDALDYLHSQNPPVIHRDIKPANIRITPQGQAMLVDFGIAKLFDPGLETTTGARAVTPGYAPFEQYGQAITDQRTDIYALGATMYTLLTGQRPAESVQRTIHDSLAPPQQINPSISPNSAAVIHQAMEMDPDKRIQSAAKFKSALAGSSSPEPVKIAPVTPTQVAPLIQPAASPAPARPSATRWGLIGGVGLLGLGAIAVIVALGIFYILSGNYGQPEPTPTSYALVTETGNGSEQGSGLMATPTPTREILHTPTGPPGTTDTTATPPLDEPALPTVTMYSVTELPPDIPIMPGAANLQSTLYEAEQIKALGITYEIDASPERILEYYERAMVINGWEKFSTYSDADNQGILFRKGEQVAQVFVIQHSGKILVSLNLQPILE